jgi:hypothetical protein
VNVISGEEYSTYHEAHHYITFLLTAFLSSLLLFPPS